MKIDVVTWTINKLIEKKEQINPKPQYQRTPVWAKSKKKLLIDSILRGYDLPKFYITETPLDPNFDYEVTDGQQRMRAIWEFTGNDEDSFDLDENVIKDINTKGLTFEDLKSKYPKSFYEKFVKFPLNIAIIEEATPEEVRSLFARLQMGDKLKPVELRHAIASNVGNTIFSLTENHPFFEESKIPNSRYKHQDYLDHVITLIYNDGDTNLKAPDMKELYLELANVDINKLQPLFKKANEILDLIKRINSHNKGCFRNKWGFVDTFYLLHENLDDIKDVKPKNFAESFEKFETKRKKHNKEPEKLIEDKSSLKYDKDMYDYITAFRWGGNAKENIKIRHRVFQNYFFNDNNFKI